MGFMKAGDCEVVGKIVDVKDFKKKSTTMTPIPEKEETEEEPKEEEKDED